MCAQTIPSKVIESSEGGLTVNFRMRFFVACRKTGWGEGLAWREDGDPTAVGGGVAVARFSSMIDESVEDDAEDEKSFEMTVWFAVNRLISPGFDELVVELVVALLLSEKNQR